jgi:integrase
LLFELPFLSESTGQEPFIKGSKTGEKSWFVPANLQEPGMYWYTKIIKLFTDAQTDRPFNHPATPHTLRHTAAIQWLNIGVPIEDVSKWLGHATLETTINHYSSDTAMSKSDRQSRSRAALTLMLAKVQTLSAPGKVIEIRRQA